MVVIHKNCIIEREFYENVHILINKKKMLKLMSTAYMVLIM